MSKPKKISLPQLKPKRNQPPTQRLEKLNEETFELIKRIAREQSHNPFSFLEKEDLENEIWIICLEALSDFKKSAGELENFLRVSVKNRLVNKFKKITKSVRSPCHRCPHFHPENTVNDCGLYKNSGVYDAPTEYRKLCDKWNNFCFSVKSRNCLLNPIELNFDRVTESDPSSVMIAAECTDKLQEELSANGLQILNDVLSNKNVNKRQYQQLIDEAKNIMEVEDV